MRIGFGRILSILTIRLPAPAAASGTGRYTWLIHE